LVQFGPLLAESQYFVKIEAAANSIVPTGSYEFIAVMGTTAIQRTQFATGSLQAPSAVQQYMLRTYRPQLFQFALSVDSAVPGDATVRMEILDTQGNLVEFLETRTGETRSKSILLPAGHFRVQLRVTNGSVFPVTYSLKGSAVDNPLGPRINNGSVPYTFVRVRGTFVPVVALVQ
jgi:hypothetical protein